MARAFLDHAVLVFPGQHLSDDEQKAFGRRFGAARDDRPDRGTDADRQRRRGDGELLAADHPAIGIMKGNEGWHTDSSYMPVSAKASMLSAHVVPSSGGQTEWADMRAAYDALPAARRSRIDGLAAHHSLVWSQREAGYDNPGPSFYGFHDGSRAAAAAGQGPPGDRPAGAVHRPSRPRHPGSAAGGVAGAARRVAGVRLPAATRVRARVGGRRPRRVGQPLRAPPGPPLRPLRAAGDEAHPRLRRPRQRGRARLGVTRTGAVGARRHASDGGDVTGVTPGRVASVAARVCQSEFYE